MQCNLPTQISRNESLMNKNSVYFPIAIIVLTVFSYQNIITVFYQQDEWQTIGNNIVLNNFLEVFSNFNLLNFISVQERFASNALAYFLMGKFAFNTNLMGVYSLLIHIINSILVYAIVRWWVIKDNNNKIFALIGSLFFAVSDVSMSAVSWFGTSLGTLPATTLILTAIFFYFKYLEKQEKKFVLLSLTLLYLSFFFKEIGVFLLLFLPFISLLFLKFTKKAFISTFWPFFGMFIIVTFLRIINLVFLSDRSGELFITSSQDNFAQEVAVRAVMYPLTSFSLTFAPPELLVNFSKYFTNTYYPSVASSEFNLIAQTVVIDVFAVFLTFIVLIAVYLSVKKKTKKTKKLAIFWVLFFALSFLPYVLLSKNYAYLESRYYYLANLSAGIIIGFLGLSLAKFLKRWNLETLPAVILILFLALHVKFLMKDLGHLALISRERVDFFNELKNLKPALSTNKNVFFLTGDHDYYIPGNKAPFQQGMGYTLMVHYYQTGHVPGELIKDRFLWNLNTQGYKEVGTMGFGFFTDLEELKKVVRNNHIDEKSITSLYYDSREKKLFLAK